MAYYVLEFHIALGEPVDAMVCGKQISGQAPTCPECGNFIGMLEWLPPRCVEMKCYGGQWPDVIKVAGGGNGILISERFRQRYESFQLNGLEDISAVEVARVSSAKRAKMPQERPAYFYARPNIVGRVDDERSGVTRRLSKGPCKICGGGDIERIESVHLAVAPDSDKAIFWPMNVRVLLATEKFAQATHDLSNVMYIEATGYGYDWSDENNRWTDLDERGNKLFPMLPTVRLATF